MLGNADGTFTTAPSPAISVYTFGPIVVADFNSDGKQDLALLNGDNNTVTILLGNGDGTFNVSASSSLIAANSKHLALADFNGDGIADLAVISNSSNLVTVLLGNGDGTFTAATSPAAGGSPNAIAVGDFNGDGNADMAVGDLYDDGISVLLGKGDGTFSAAATLHSGSDGSPIAVADFNGDGKPDLAIGVISATPGGDAVTILAGNGDGTFTSPSSGTPVSSAFITALQVGDFNADGIPDLALLDSTTGYATVFAGNGAGSFTATSLPPATAPYYNLVLALGDIDGDGRSDLVIGNSDSSGVSVLRTRPTETATATSDITLTKPGQHIVDASYPGNANYHSSVSGTIPLWGIPPATTTSLILTSGSTKVTAVAPGTVVTLTASVNAGASAVTAGQVNFCDAAASHCTDIHLLASAQLTSNGTAVFKFVPGLGQHSYKAVFVESGAGMGSVSNIAALLVGPAKAPVYSETTSIAVGGFPGNYSLTATVEGFGGPASPTGKVSFLDTSFGNNVLASANLGTAAPGMGWLISPAPALTSNPVSEVTGDFNGDGLPDLAILWSTSLTTGPAGITIFFGKSDGTFTTGPTTQLALTNQLDPYMITGDFNGDGKTDLVIFSWQVGFNVSTVTSLLGNGDGTFAAPINSPAFNQGVVGGDGVPGSVVAADFNGDGKLDLAAVGDYVAPGGLTVLLGNGDGTFTAAGPNLSANLDFSVVGTGDFNGDGIPDLVASRYFGPGGASVFLGKGDGNFTAMPTTLNVGSFPKSMVVGDFNGDGIPDLAFGSDGAVAVFLGSGDGNFTQAPGSPVAGGGLSLVMGDFNHDGKMDLAGIDNYNVQIDLFTGAGDGTFTESVTTPNVGQNALGPFAIAAADFNGDGVPDLSLLTTNVPSASILITEPTETATATVTGIAPIGAGTHNVDASYPGDSHYQAGVSAVAPLTAGLAPLVVTPPAGTYTSVQTITLSEPIPGATIYYSAAGPLSTSGFLLYTGPITLSSAGVQYIQAYAAETGYQQSDYLTAIYTLVLPPTTAPTISLASGYYAGAQTATITDAQTGAKIYYTTNGTVPTVNSNLYSGPITISSSETLVAAAVAYGYAFSPAVSAKYYIGSSATSLIYTIAGSGTYGYTGDNGPATLAQLDGPAGVVKDSAGNVYVSDSNSHMVRKVAAGTGTITRFAGTGTIGYSGDGGQATSAELSLPTTLLIDAGNLFIADNGNGTIRKLNLASGIITTYAGNPAATAAGDGGPATAASLGFIGGMAIDASHNVYIAEINPCVIREVNSATGMISTIAGTGTFGYSGDGGPAISAVLGGPYGMAFDGSGSLLIADTGNDLIRKITATGGVITGSSVISTVAGTVPTQPFFSPGGYSGDGGPATSAKLSRPISLAFDSSGNLLISDSGNSAIRMVAAGNISTVAGDGLACQSYGGDGDTATSAALCFPGDIAVDTSGDILIADEGFNRVREVFAPGTPPTTPAAAPTLSVSSGTYGSPQTVTVSDTTPGASIYVTVDGSAATTARAQGYSFPINVAGALTINAIATAPGYLASAPASAAYTITSSSPVITTVAGKGLTGFSGTGGPALNAQFGVSYGIAIDKSGNIYLSDNQNNVVWLISAATGNASLFAGTGTRGLAGDGGPATGAQFSSPQGIALDSGGNLYIADSGNYRIRKVDATTGVISTVAGGAGGGLGNIGDGGPATSASLVYPSTVALDGAGNLYIGDSGHFAVRVVSATTGIINTVAGNGTDTFSGDGGPATQAGIESPDMLAVDKGGNIYVASVNSARVRKVTAATGVITTVAGIGDLHGNTGDGGPATSAEIDAQSISVDAAENLYLADWPGQIRRVDANTGVITKVAGIGFGGFSGDGGAALAAELLGPSGMTFNSAGDLYFADTYNFRVRKITFAVQTAAVPVFSIAPGAYATAQTVSITDTTPAAVIYYTTDGSTPGTSSTVYSGAITVSASETINALATAANYNTSAIASAAYVIGGQAAAPSLTSFSPAFTSAGSAAFSLTVNGAGFTSASTINWATTALSTQYVSASQLTAQVPASLITTAGVIAVTVQTPAPGGGTSNALSFEIDTAGSGTPPAFGTTSATVTAGATATYPVTLPSTATNISVKCLNLPQGAACSYSASDLTITTAATTPKGTYLITVVFTETLPGANAALAFLLLLPWAFRGRRKKKRLWIIGSMALVVAAVGVGGGCGGGGGSGTPPPQTHQVTSSGTVTLIVK